MLSKRTCVYCPASLSVMFNEVYKCIYLSMILRCSNIRMSSNMLTSIGLVSLLSFVCVFTIFHYINSTTTRSVSGQVGVGNGNQVNIAVAASDPRTVSPYSPAFLSVPLGTTVTWKNNDQTFHTVTSGDPSTGPDTRFDSGILSPLASFERTFSEPGIFSYFCTIHPFMRGEVRVG